MSKENRSAKEDQEIADAEKTPLGIPYDLDGEYALAKAEIFLYRLRDATAVSRKDAKPSDNKVVAEYSSNQYAAYLMGSMETCLADLKTSRASH